jgi:hypothetical protein
MQNKSVARVLACLLTDGGVTFRSGNRGVIHFTNKSEKLRKEFSEACKDVFGVTPKDDGIECRIFSFELAQNLVQTYATSFRKKKLTEEDKLELLTAIIPHEIMNSDEETIKEFLRYAFSCDGSVSLSVRRTRNRWYFQKKIQLKCSLPNLLSQYQTLLQKLGIYSRKEERYQRLIIDSRQGITEFINLIGFVDGVKISGKGGSEWKNLEKNQLLKIFIYLYEIYDSLGAQRFLGGFWNKKFKSKEEIISFLRQKASS